MADEQLASLLERVNAAAGPDRELDGRLFVGLKLDPSLSNLSNHPGHILDGSRNHHTVPAYTASIDAAVALVERVHPWNPWFDIKGCQPRKDGSPGALWVVAMDGAVECRAPTLPLAILAALLDALVVREASTC